MRENSASRFLAMLFTARVLARPGSPSTRILPLASRAMISRSTIRSWPMMSWLMRSLSWPMASMGVIPLPLIVLENGGLALF
jgi:hypothetical protein